MKALLTFILLLFLSVGVFAQKRSDHVKMENIQMDSFLGCRSAATFSGGEIKKVSAQKVARLYRFKNARIKKELAFKTKKQRLTV